MTTAMHRVYTYPKGVRRLLWAAAFLGGLALEGVKSALRRTPPVGDFKLTPSDVQGEMPTVPTWGPGRWTKGGEA